MQKMPVPTEVEEKVDEKYSFSFVENLEHRLLLESAMQILEEEERQILFLHAVAGWKNREIAASNGAVRKANAERDD